SHRLADYRGSARLQPCDPVAKDRGFSPCGTGSNRNLGFAEENAYFSAVVICSRYFLTSTGRLSLKRTGSSYVPVVSSYRLEATVEGHGLLICSRCFLISTGGLPWKRIGSSYVLVVSSHRLADYR